MNGVFAIVIVDDSSGLAAVYGRSPCRWLSPEIIPTQDYCSSARCSAAPRQSYTRGESSGMERD